MAILMVMAVHAFQYQGTNFLGRSFDTIARSGWTGVTLFFVLSGFLISGILIDTKEKPHYLRDFFGRRSLRIFPIYFAFLAVYFFVAPRLPSLSTRLPLPPPGVEVYYWTYLTNMIEFLHGAPPTVRPLDPLWSLAVEEQIYVFWPFIFLFTPTRQLPKLLGTFVVVSFLWRFSVLLFKHSIHLSYYWTFANLEAFAYGAIVAWLLRFDAAALARWSPRVLLGAGGFVLGMCVGQRHFNFWEAPTQVLTVGTTGVVLLFASLIGCCVTSRGDALHNRWLSVGWLRRIGKYSYAMYLFHASIIALLFPMLLERAWSSRPLVDLGQYFVFAATVGVLSYGAAWVSWRVWESPFLSLKRFFPLTGNPVQPPQAVANKVGLALRASPFFEGEETTVNPGVG